MAYRAMSLECSGNSEAPLYQVQRLRGGSDKVGEVGRMAPAGQCRPRQEFTIQSWWVAMSHNMQSPHGANARHKRVSITPPSHNPYYNPQGGKKLRFGPEPLADLQAVLEVKELLFSYFTVRCLYSWLTWWG